MLGLRSTLHVHCYYCGTSGVCCNKRATASFVTSEGSWAWQRFCAEIGVSEAHVASLVEPLCCISQDNPEHSWYNSMLLCCKHQNRCQSIWPPTVSRNIFHDCCHRSRSYQIQERLLCSQALLQSFHPVLPPVLAHQCCYHGLATPSSPTCLLLLHSEHHSSSQSYLEMGFSFSFTRCKGICHHRHDSIQEHLVPCQGVLDHVHAPLQSVQANAHTVMLPVPDESLYAPVCVDFTHSDSSQGLLHKTLSCSCSSVHGSSSQHSCIQGGMVHSPAAYGCLCLLLCPVLQLEYYHGSMDLEHSLLCLPPKHPKGNHNCRTGQDACRMLSLSCCSQPFEQRQAAFQPSCMHQNNILLPEQPLLSLLLWHTSLL